MAEGDTFPILCMDLSPTEAELVDWHLDNGTAASWIAAALTGHGHSIGVSTVKAYRRRVNRDSLYGVGEPTPGLLEMLDVKRIEMEELALKAATPRVLIFDIERVPAKIEGTIWSRGSMKGRWIPGSWVKERDYTILWAAKWHGEEEVFRGAVWDGSMEAMLRPLWELLDEADIIVGHNMKSFDRKHVNTEFLLAGMKRPSPYKVVDTLLIARRELSLIDNTLGALCTLFGIPTKTDKYDETVAFAAVNGDEQSQDKLTDYCIGDVIASDALYSFMRFHGLVQDHPVMTPGFARRCPNCQSSSITPMPKPYVANIMVYKQWRCRDCSAISRERIGQRITDLRLVKA